MPKKIIRKKRWHGKPVPCPRCGLSLRSSRLPVHQAQPECNAEYWSRFLHQQGYVQISSYHEVLERAGVTIQRPSNYVFEREKVVVRGTDGQLYEVTEQTALFEGWTPEWAKKIAAMGYGVSPRLRSADVRARVIAACKGQALTQELVMDDPQMAVPMLLAILDGELD